MKKGIKQRAFTVFTTIAALQPALYYFQAPSFATSSFTTAQAVAVPSIPVAAAAVRPISAQKTTNDVTPSQKLNTKPEVAQNKQQDLQASTETTTAHTTGHAEQKSEPTQPAEKSTKTESMRSATESIKPAYNNDTIQAQWLGSTPVTSLHTTPTHSAAIKPATLNSNNVAPATNKKLSKDNPEPTASTQKAKKTVPASMPSEQPVNPEREMQTEQQDATSTPVAEPVATPAPVKTPAQQNMAPAATVPIQAASHAHATDPANTFTPESPSFTALPYVPPSKFGRTTPPNGFRRPQRTTRPVAKKPAKNAHIRKAVAPKVKTGTIVKNNKVKEVRAAKPSAHNGRTQKAIASESQFETVKINPKKQARAAKLMPTNAETKSAKTAEAQTAKVETNSKKPVHAAKLMPTNAETKSAKTVEAQTAKVETNPKKSVHAAKLMPTNAETKSAKTAEAQTAKVEPNPKKSVLTAKLMPTDAETKLAKTAETQTAKAKTNSTINARAAKLHVPKSTMPKNLRARNSKLPALAATPAVALKIPTIQKLKIEKLEAPKIALKAQPLALTAAQPTIATTTTSAPKAPQLTTAIAAPNALAIMPKTPATRKVIQPVGQPQQVAATVIPQHSTEPKPIADSRTAATPTEHMQLANNSRLEQAGLKCDIVERFLFNYAKKYNNGTPLTGTLTMPGKDGKPVFEITINKAEYEKAMETGMYSVKVDPEKAAEVEKMILQECGISKQATLTNAATTQPTYAHNANSAGTLGRYTKLEQNPTIAPYRSRPPQLGTTTTLIKSSNHGFVPRRTGIFNFTRRGGNAVATAACLGAQTLGQVCNAHTAEAPSIAQPVAVTKATPQLEAPSCSTSIRTAEDTKSSTLNGNHMKDYKEKQEVKKIVDSIPESKQKWIVENLTHKPTEAEQAANIAKQAANIAGNMSRAERKQAVKDVENITTKNPLTTWVCSWFN